MTASKKRAAGRKTGERLIQTVVPDSLAAWVDARARAEGVTVAAYLRRALLREQAEASGDDRVRHVVDYVDMLIQEHAAARAVQPNGTLDISALPGDRQARLVELRQNLYMALKRAVRGTP